MNSIYWVVVGIVAITASTVPILNFSLSGQNVLVGVVYGQSASSLEELESQLEQANSLESRLANYRAALIDYIESNNIAVNEDLYESSTDTLEKIVEEHMGTPSQVEMPN
jgi:hypothetical protein